MSPGLKSCPFCGSSLAKLPLAYVDKEDVLNFLGELMAYYADREQFGKADLVSDAIKLIVGNVRVNEPEAACDHKWVGRKGWEALHCAKCPATKQVPVGCHEDGRRKGKSPLTADNLADRLAGRPVQTLDTLCDDCPPDGWPTDRARCADCPRRNDHDRICQDLRY